MRMNRIETWAVNNAARRARQRHYEAPLLHRLGADLAGAHVVEVGCGHGAGTEVLLDRFHAGRVSAFDLDDAQVARAGRRLRDRSQASVQTGDISDLPFADGTVDAVADFGTVHHVPDWRAAVAELARVIRPGGQLVFEEVTRHALDRASYRLLFDHPSHDRFTGQQFVRELADNGLPVDDRVAYRFFGDFVLGVAVRA